MTSDSIKQNLDLSYKEKLHCETILYVLENEVDLDIKFTAMESLTKIHDDFNKMVRAAGLEESCTVKGTDSASTVRKKCKKAFRHGLKHYPMNWIYSVDGTHTDTSADVGGMSEYGSNAMSTRPRVPARDNDEVHNVEPSAYPNSGYTGAWAKDKVTPPKPLTLRFTDDETIKREKDEFVDEAESSTERVRRYYKRHPERVRAYLRKTVKDRVARNRDRAKAVKKHGKAKMKNHDVHHPNGAQNGNWRLAKKDHGRDKVNESTDNNITCRFCGWKWKLSDGGNMPYMCHKCWQENKNYLMEGGAAGHLAHPYEDDSLTFAQMRDMVEKGLVGDLGSEAPVTEKLDGQNLTFSVRDGQVVFARNKGHIKNRGKNALPAKDLRQMFAGRGNIETSFGNAADDLQSAIDRLSDEQKQAMFGNGSKFMNLEVIFPDTENVIPYGKSVLVFHGTIEYDEEGNEIGRNVDDGKLLDQQLHAVQAKEQATYGLSGPTTISFSDADIERNREKAERFNAEIDAFRDEFGLDDNATLEDYKKAWWSQRIDQMGIDWTADEKERLIQRWALGDKQAIGSKDIKDPEKKAAFREFESSELKSAQKQSTRKLESIFLRVGAESLRRVTNTISANNPEAAKKLKQQLVDTIQQIKDAGDEDQLAILQQQIEKLDDIGIDSVIPTEGVVFVYNGKPYKFTGAFAPVNQILGMMKFQRGKAKVSSEESTDDGDSKQEPKDAESSKEEPADKEPPQEAPVERKPVAIFPGRFQPFHAGHYSIYQSLVEKFGAENVYIATSDKTDAIKSPFGFAEKKDIITRMFGIPEDRVIQTAQPYRPSEITEKLPEGTPVVFSLSEKDKERLAGKYFKPYEDGQELSDYTQAGYVIVAPEMQLQLKGKNISGTQLRHIFGSSKYTDRAKEEIFTMVYGKFDQEVFDKIVKTTTESEKAREITDKYSDDKSETEPETSSEEPGSKELSPQAKRAKSVLTQKIRNPKTGRDIYVATALKYNPDEPVRQAAEKIVRDAMSIKEFILTENKELDKLKVYVYTRDFTDEEMENELGEYFENKKTKTLFPDLADSEKELQQMIEDADEKVLSKKELKNLQNSDVGEVLKSDDPLKVVNRVAKENKRDVASLKNAFDDEKDLPMPIVIKHSDGYYLMGGNTRLVMLAAKKYTMPVKVLKYNKMMDLKKAKALTAKLSSKKDKGKTEQDPKDLFKKLMQMKITNSETGNQIKIDTAMDYDKNHPAHILARNIIRQHMGDISSRAGVAKDSGPKKKG